MRVNESFGEVVQWGLSTRFCYSNMQILVKGTIFGQNAIGGSNGHEMKNGFNFQGAYSVIWWDIRKNE